MENKRKNMEEISALNSPRFSQIATFARLPVSRNLEGLDSVFVGVPFDTGTTYRTGARFGPSSVREESRILRPFSLSSNTMPFEKLNVADYGDIEVFPLDIERTIGSVKSTLSNMFRAHIFPLVCGGDHSVTLGVLRAIAESEGPVSLVHFDSHFDFWDQYQGYKYNHGTWLRRALDEGLVKNVYQVGIRGSAYSTDDLEFARSNGIHVKTIYEIRERGFENVMQEVCKGISKEGAVHVSIDIDSVDPAFAPATGTPEIGGLTSWEITRAVRLLLEYRVKCLDVVEISPVYDHPGKITSVLGANIFYEALATIAKKKN